jgi:hypothetical protein
MTLCTAGTAVAFERVENTTGPTARNIQHLATLLVAASQNPAIADAYADGFANPLPTWELLQSPARVAALLDTLG